MELNTNSTEPKNNQLIEFFSIKVEKNSVSLQINNSMFLELLKSILPSVYAFEKTMSGNEVAIVYSGSSYRFDSKIVCYIQNDIKYIFEYNLVDPDKIVVSKPYLGLLGGEIEEIIKKGFYASSYGQLNNLLNELWAKFKGFKTSNDSSEPSNNEQEEQSINYDPDKLYLKEIQQPIILNHIKCIIPKICIDLVKRYGYSRQRSPYDTRQRHLSNVMIAGIHAVKFSDKKSKSSLGLEKNSNNLILKIGTSYIFDTSKDDYFEWKIPCCNKYLESIKKVMIYLNDWVGRNKEKFIHEIKEREEKKKIEEEKRKVEEEKRKIEKEKKKEQDEKEQNETNKIIKMLKTENFIELK